LRGVGDPNEHLRRLRRHAWETASAAALSAAAVVVLLWPVARRPNVAVLREPNDLSSSARDLWAAHALGKNPFTFVHDSLFHAPAGQILSPAVQVANALQPLVVMALRPLAGYLGAFNLFMLGGLFASLFATYLFLRTIGCGRFAAALSSLGFVFSQFTIEQLLYGHSAFAQLWVFPLVAGLVLWSRQGSPYRAVAAGASLAIAFYASSYLGLFVSVAALLLVCVSLVETAPPGRRQLLLRAGIGMSVAGLLLLPALLAPYWTATSTLNLPPWGKQNFIGARLSDYFLPSTHHLIEGRLTRSVTGTHVGEHVAFFGFGLLVLAAVALTALLRGNLRWSTSTKFAVLAVLVGWWLALPAYGQIAGHSVPLPDAANIVGGAVSWWRIYARFASLSGFGFAILAARGVDYLRRQGSRRGALAVAICTGIVLLDSLPGVPVQTASLTPDFATRWLQRHPGGIVASYPVVPGNQNIDAWDRSYWGFYYLQVYHHHPMFDPPQGEPQPTTSEMASYLAEDLHAADTPAILRAEGVRYVVTHDNVYRLIGEPVPTGRLNGLRLLSRGGGESIYRVTAAPANLVQLLSSDEPRLARQFAFGDPTLQFGSGFYGTEHFQGWRAARWLQQDGEVLVTPSVGRAFIRYKLTLWAFANGQPRTLSLEASGKTYATFVVPTSASVFTATVQLPGATRFVLHADPGPTPLGGGDMRSASIYVEHLELEPVGLSLDDGKTNA
jgi:hypothetical protein